ncbi:MAG: AAA family ATPase [Methanoregula sp.]|nr:AAA family ATPase [Methanoregula sp.]
MSVVLPEKKNVAETGFPDQASWLVFGAPKVGKTSFVQQWPEPLILNLEPGGCRYISDAYVMDIGSLKELRDVYATLAAKKGAIPYKTIAIDTIDVVNDWAEEQALAELGIKEMGEGHHGTDWARSRTITLNTIKTFAGLPVNLLVIAHSRWAIVNEVTVGHTIDLPGKLARFTMSAIENILFVAAGKNGERHIIFRPTEGIESGSRNPALGKVATCEFSYAALRALFNKKGEK